MRLKTEARIGDEANPCGLQKRNNEKARGEQRQKEKEKKVGKEPKSWLGVESPD